MQQIRHAGDHFVGIDRLRRQWLLPREGQKPLGEDGSALGRVGCGFDETLNAELALANAPQNEIVRADDHAQHIVEVVSDAAGQLAERLHLLRLPKLVLDFLATTDLLDQLLIGERQPVACCRDRLESPAQTARPARRELRSAEMRQLDADLRQQG